MSQTDDTYGGGPGQMSEELVKELLQKSGWRVKELRKASDNGRAPLLESSDRDQNLRLVDFQAHNDSRDTHYIEVKSKAKARYLGVEDEYRHGWEAAQHEDYQEFARTYTNDPVYIFVHERKTGVILRAKIRELHVAQRVDDESKLRAFNGEPMVFFRREDFDVVTDNVTQYTTGFGQSSIVKEGIELSPFGGPSKGQAGLTEFGGVDR